VKDPNKIYEKYKMVSNMEEYLSYLNSIKNVHGESEQSNYQHKRSSHHYKSDYSSSKDNRRRKHRDFKDLDDPENAGASAGQSNAGRRKLISYDDL
jgi:hypothetical protein